MVPPIRRFDRLLSLDYYIDYTHMVLGLVAAEAADPPSMAVAASSMVAVLGLVLVNGFFVAAEFSLVAARRSKLDEMIAKGDRAARTVQTALQNLDRYIAATQLGITIASLALGWVGEPVLAQLFDQAFRTLGVNPSPTTTHVAAVPVAFFLLTFFHIVLGELAPKSIALASPERTARAVTRPLMVFSRFMSPFIWLFNGA
ncbi:MAG: CNNM domain-containing protein, partial [Gemmatimonadaceae bacterium]